MVPLLVLLLEKAQIDEGAAEAGGRGGVAVQATRDLREGENVRLRCECLRAGQPLGKSAGTVPPSGRVGLIHRLSPSSTYTHSAQRQSKLRAARYLLRRLISTGGSKNS